MNISFIYSYSKFLYDMSKKDKKEKTYYYQVCFLLNTITKTDLVSFLNNLSIDREQRKKVFADLFAKKLDKKLIYFVWTVIDFNRATYLEKILRGYLEIYDDIKGISFIKVFSVYPLTTNQLNSIKNVLHKKFKKQIVLENIIDPSIIGGIRIESKGLSIDNTFKKKLETIKQELTSPIEKEVSYE